MGNGNSTGLSFNGGGSGMASTDYDDGGGGGGGATDIRLVNGDWDNFDSLKSRIMVAGGGSGSAVIDYNFNGRAGGSGGGVSANGSVWTHPNNEISNHSYNATQKTGYKFGIGENGVSIGNAGGAGAGGGYMGGLSSKETYAGGAGGGSGFVSGCEQCFSISEDSTENNVMFTDQSIHYSGKVFSDIELKNGNELIPTHDGTSTMIGNDGNGYAKIKLIEKVNAGEFDYTGSEQTFTAQENGLYRIELWGAQGNMPSSKRSVGGAGSYTSGEISLEQGDKLYVYVGEHRTDTSTSFNAGSIGGISTDSNNGGGVCGYGGGGATDVRLVSGSWNDSGSLSSRIMVAAGGGGASDYAFPASGGAGGTLTGKSGNNGKYPDRGYLNTPPTGGTQTLGGNTSATINGVGSIGQFGIGGNGNSQWGSAGGGGYYGGGGGGWSDYSVDSGAGGSSYISCYTGCVAIKSNSDITPKDGCSDGTSDITCSYHYSGKIFTKPTMIAGDKSMKSPSGTIETGHSGNGYARITFIGR